MPSKYPHATKPPIPQPIHSILLVTRTRTGPRLDLYYPPTSPTNHPYFHIARSKLDAELNSESDSYGSSDSDSNSYSDGYEDDDIDRITAMRSKRRRRRRHHQQLDEAKHEANGSGKPAGHSTLSSLPPYNSPSQEVKDKHATAASVASAGVARPISRSSSWTKFKAKQMLELDGEHQRVPNANESLEVPQAQDSAGQAANNSVFQYNAAQNKSLHLLDTSGMDEEGVGSSLLSGLEKSEILAKLLTPSSRSWHKSRFEVGVENFTFLACPIFERKTGGWRSRPAQGLKNVKQTEDQVKDGTNLQQQTSPDSDLTEPSNGRGAAGEDDLDEMKLKQEIDGDDTAEDLNGLDQTIVEHSQDTTSQLSETRPTIKPAPALQDTGTSFASTSSVRSTPGNYEGAPATGTGSAPESLTMFHLVFVVISPSRAPGEHQACVKTIYKNVVKPMTKALAYAQQKNNFVWAEMRLITNILANANLHGKANEKSEVQNVTAGSSAAALPSYADVWKTISAKSELARAIETAYDCITAGNIAHLTFGRGITQSLQIPQPMTTAHVMTPMSPQYKGLRPSTFNTAQAPERKHSQDMTRDNVMINPYSALLLLQDTDDLITQELPRAGRGTADLILPLTYLVRHCLPTKTLIQMSKKLGISQTQVQMLSMHLVKYRLAIAIPPLHPSNTYVVSPNANFDVLQDAAKEFDQRFAMLPGLLTILGKISNSRSTGPAGPRPWISLIPSSDHKAAYMEILEWLVRGGWVVQLRTFCWVQVSPEIKADVARIMRQEEEEKAAVEAAEEAALLISEEEEVDSDQLSDAQEIRRLSSGSGRASASRNGDGVSTTPAASALSPRLRPYLFTSGITGPPSEAGSSSTAKTTVRISNFNFSSSKTPTVVASRNPSGNREHRQSDDDTEHKISLDESRSRKEEKPEIRASDFDRSIIASPQRANAIESRWLKHIAYTLPHEELRTIWPRLVKYFDGKQAIEEISMREGLKRKVVTPILAKLVRDNDILLTVRHW